MVRLIIVDDHALYRNAATSALAPHFATCEILNASTFAELEGLLSSDPDIDLVLLDLNLPDVEGMHGLRRLRSRYPGLPVAVMSGSDDRRLMRSAIEIGASGFVHKTQCIQTLRRSVELILSGQIWLPPQN
ncbi:MAG: response regulator [Hyphomicrobiaceae bacterium]